MISHDQSTYLWPGRLSQKVSLAVITDHQWRIENIYKKHRRLWSPDLSVIRREGFKRSHKPRGFLTTCPNRIQKVTRQTKPKVMTEYDHRTYQWPEGKDLNGHNTSPKVSTAGPNRIQKVTRQTKPKVMTEYDHRTYQWPEGKDLNSLNTSPKVSTAGLNRIQKVKRQTKRSWPTVRLVSWMEGSKRS